MCSDSQIVLLKDLYKENDYPSDRLIRDELALRAFCCEFNKRASSSYSEEQVAAELERVRKDKRGTGGLPKLGRAFKGPKLRPMAA